MSTAIRVVLGGALLLHGLANTVLPLRGADAGAPGNWLEPITLLWVVAVIGFVAAGLGVLGVRPLRHAITIPSLLAGAAALGVQFWQPDVELWPGVVLSAVLPLLASLAAYANGAPVQSAHPRWRLIGDMAGIAVLVWVTASATLWPWHRAWGTHPQEWQSALPGDRAPRTPTFEIMHATTIEAPPDAVWPWLAQIGQDRGGFYSYAFLERAFGVRIANADRIHPEWQTLRPGDRVYATQPDYLGGLIEERPGWTVEQAIPNRVLILHNWGAFVLLPGSNNTTRFIIRSTISNERIPAWLAAINFTAFELPHFIMQRRMMLGIKERAERGAKSFGAVGNISRLRSGLPAESRVSLLGAHAPGGHACCLS